MSAEAIIILIGIAVAVLVIWMSVFLWKIDDERWDRVMNAPKFIIKPSYDLGFDIWEKELFPIPGHAPYMSYRPLFGQYKTREEAEKQLAHYNDSNVDQSGDQ